MVFERFTVEGLAHNSYLIACERSGEAVVVDPRRDIDVYVALAGQRGLRLSYTIDTHIHADFVSGGPELIAIGARCLSGPGSGLAYPSREVADGETLAVGGMRLTFLHTPGHTPEHITILADAPGQPTRAFTGDALFVGAVGRPDLLGEDWTRRLASQLYDTLYHTLLGLDDAVEVHPAHGAGSLCGRAIGSAVSSTIGFERETNAMLRLASRDEFVKAVLADLPETPAYFPRMKRINHDGPAVLGLARGVATPPAIAPRDAAARARAGAWLLDCRDAAAFGAGHPQGAVHLAFGSRVGYWAGFVLPGEARLVLLVDDDLDVPELVRQLLRVGFDGIEGVVAGGFPAWRDAGLPVAGMPAIGVDDLRGRLEAGGLRLVDVRAPSEWREDHLEGAVHVPLGDIPAVAAAARGAASALGPAGTEVAVICAGGYRSSLAASLLARAGVDKVASVEGGLTALRELETSESHAR